MPQALRSLATGSLTLLIIRLLSILATLAVLPRMLAVLGEEHFGLWAIGFSFLSLVTILDLGIDSVGTVQLGQQQQSKALRLGPILYTVAAVMIGLCVYLSPGSLYGIAGVPRGATLDMRYYLLGLTLAWLLQQLAKLWAVPLDLLGRFAISRGLVGLAHLLVPLVALLTATSLPSVRWLGLAMATPFGLMAMAMYALRAHLVGKTDLSAAPHPRTRHDHASVRTAPSRQNVSGLRFGLQLQMAAVGDVINFSSDRLLIGGLLGIASVAPFEFANKVAMMAHSLSMLPVGLLFPVLARSSLTGARRRQNVETAFRAHTAMIVGMGTGIAIAGTPALHMWAGATIARETGPLLLLLLPAYMVHATTAVYSIVYRAQGRYGLPAVFSVFCASTNIVATILLAPAHGLRGVALGTLLGLAAPSLMYLSYMGRALKLGKLGLRILLQASTLALAFSTLGILITSGRGPVAAIAVALVAAALSAGLLAYPLRSKLSSIWAHS